jgi:hypothetical protein
MPQLPYRFSDKAVTPWGGLRLIQEFYERCGLRSQIRQLDLPVSGSNRGYQATDIIEGFLVSVILGAKRFAHSGMLRHDSVIGKIFGWKKGMASQSTFSRFFPKITLEQSDHNFAKLNSWWFSQLQIDKITVDIDSTVLTRFGEQECVEVGYNPRRHGRASHHPIIAFAAEPKMVIQAWMRSGDSAASTDFKDFFKEILAVLPQQRIGLVRADSGFYGNDTLEYLEKERVKYIISARMNAGLIATIFNQRAWFRSQDGIEYCSFEYQAKGWNLPRRMVVVRKDSEKLSKSGGKTLFPEYDDFSKYRYSAFVTNSELSADLVWTVYKHRAEAENQIKELKYDYGIEGFCSQKFEGTEAAFRWAMVAYNLMSLFRLTILKNKHSPVLSTIKFQCIAIGSYLVKKSRKKELILAVKDQKRVFIENLFIKIGKTAPPFLISIA